MVYAYHNRKSGLFTLLFDRQVVAQCHVKTNTVAEREERQERLKAYVLIVHPVAKQLQSVLVST